MTKKPSGINAAWHKQHPMPENLSIQQRIDWHLEHSKNCGCLTDIPEKLKVEMKKLKIKIPAHKK
jgi:hypothetical protein